MKNVCFGIDLGGTSVKMGLFSTAGSVIEKWEIATRKEEGGRYILSDIAKSVSARMEGRSLNEVVGLGMGVPGPVTEDGTVLKCANLGWGVFNVAEEISRLTGIKNVKVGNDANVAALGEMWQGGGRGYKNMVMVTLGTGVGGGVILDGNILTGSKGAAGEIGHITVNPNETDTCGCGKKGCLEQYASATGIVRVANRILNMTDQPSLLRNKKHFSAKVVFDRAKEGDQLALEVVEEFGRYLGLTLAHVAHVIDPEAFVIGGGVSKAGQIILDTVSKYYENNVMFALQNRDFHLAELGNDAGIFGSAKMVIQD